MVITLIAYLLVIVQIGITTKLIIDFYKKNKFNHKSHKHANSFSIIIPVKNEEKNLPSLFESLNSIEYEDGDYEIIFIDDKSTDETSRLLAGFAQTNSGCRIIFPEGKKYPGKKGALQAGIENAEFEYIITTDGDCVIPKNWLREFSKRFSVNCGIVFGPVKIVGESNFVGKIARFESARKNFLTFGAAAAGYPYSAGGANFGFAKSFFNSIGGYSNTLETLSGDDDLFIREAVKYNLNVCAETEAAVETSAPKTFSEYLKQKARHTSTSVYYSLSRKIFLSVWHLSNILLTSAIIAAFFIPELIIPAALKIASDIFSYRASEKIINYNFNIFQIICFQIIYEILLIINFINSNFREIKWKE